MLHIFHEVLEIASIVIDGVASAVMVWAFLVSVFTFVKISIDKAQNSILQLQLVRCELGIKLVFALELMVIADLLHTIVSRTLEDLWFLGAIVLIRTVVGYFLNREIAEIESAMQSRA